MFSSARVRCSWPWRYSSPTGAAIPSATHRRGGSYPSAAAGRTPLPRRVVPLCRGGRGRSPQWRQSRACPAVPGHPLRQLARAAGHGGVRPSAGGGLAGRGVRRVPISGVAVAVARRRGGEGQRPVGGQSRVAPSVGGHNRTARGAPRHGARPLPVTELPVTERAPHLWCPVAFRFGRPTGRGERLGIRHRRPDWDYLGGPPTAPYCRADDAAAQVLPRDDPACTLPRTRHAADVANAATPGAARGSARRRGGHGRCTQCGGRVEHVLQELPALGSRPAAVATERPWYVRLAIPLPTRRARRCSGHLRLCGGGLGFKGVGGGDAP